MIKGKTIYFSFVDEDDAEFILSLRGDHKLNKYLSTTSTTVASQVEWIKNYKLKENKQQEYYFIIKRIDNNNRIGTLRIYDFKPLINSFCWGSWILNSNKTRYAAVESAILVYLFAFETLNFERAHFDVRKDNKNVIQFHEKFGAKKISENELDNFYSYEKNQFKTFLKNNDKYIK